MLWRAMCGFCSCDKRHRSTLRVLRISARRSCNAHRRRTISCSRYISSVNRNLYIMPCSLARTCVECGMWCDSLWCDECEHCSVLFFYASCSCFVRAGGRVDASAGSLPSAVASDRSTTRERARTEPGTHIGYLSISQGMYDVHRVIIIMAQYISQHPYHIHFLSYESIHCALTRVISLDTLKKKQHRNANANWKCTSTICNKSMPPCNNRRVLSRPKYTTKKLHRCCCNRVNRTSR